MENKGDPYFYHTRKRVTTKFRNSMDNLDLMNDLKARDNLDMQTILTPYENEGIPNAPATPNGLV